MICLEYASIILVLRRKTVFLLLLLFHRHCCLGILLNDVIIVGLHFGRLPSLLVDHSLLFLVVLLFLGLFVGIDQAHNFLVFELVEPQLLLLFLQDELLPLEFVLEVFALSL